MFNGKTKKENRKKERKQERKSFIIFVILIFFNCLCSFSLIVYLICKKNTFFVSLKHKQKVKKFNVKYKIVI